MESNLESISIFFRKQYNKIEDIFLDMTLELAHDYLFLTPHFPIFFIIQTIYICYIVRKYSNNKSWYVNILTSAFMTFFGRVLTAYFTMRRPPLFERQYYLPIFLLIWFLVNCSPYDFFYSILDHKFLVLLFQIAYGLIQIRETCHGVNIGFRAFPNSSVGAILISIILSSTESIVWLVNNDGIRQFSGKVFIKNLMVSIIYLLITNQFPYINKYIELSKEEAEIYLTVLNEVIVIIDCIAYGIMGTNGIDISLLTHVNKILEYKGNQ